VTFCLYRFRRRSVSRERAPAQAAELRVKAIQQNLDRLGEAFLSAESVDLISCSRQCDELREELTSRPHEECGTRPVCWAVATSASAYIEGDRSKRTAAPPRRIRGRSGCHLQTFSTWPLRHHQRHQPDAATDVLPRSSRYGSCQLAADRAAPATGGAPGMMHRPFCARCHEEPSPPPIPARSPSGSCFHRCIR
jgi:hypothetical protein